MPGLDNPAALDSPLGGAGYNSNSAVRSRPTYFYGSTNVIDDDGFDKESVNTVSECAENKDHDQEEDQETSQIAVYIRYVLALAILVLVFVVPAFTHHDDHHDTDGHNVMRNIAYGSVAAGALAYLMHLLKQPLVLGYLLGGVLVGPIGLRIIISEEEIHTISELGLIFLLFMIGLELNVRELALLGKQVFLGGLMQFPVCCGMHWLMFKMLAMAGFTMGGSGLSSLYIIVCCAISSTMVAVKLLQQKMETDTYAGRITVGILIFQDIWAIVILAVQPNLSNPNFMKIANSFCMMMILVLVAFAYSKWVLPVMLRSAAHATEVMLVLSLAWCFFVCVVALLPFIDVSMEVGALVAGISMATFPYSIELNAKIKYIRDFFVTLYFVGLGMQIPVPHTAMILKACVLTVVVLVGRWCGVFMPLYFLGTGGRPATLTCLNLSTVSEFSLVIGAMGKTFGHIDDDTMAILILTFAIMAVLCSKLSHWNHYIYTCLVSAMDSLALSPRTPRPFKEEASSEASERDIVFLGLFKVAWALLDELEKRSPEILSRIMVVDFNEANREILEARGIHFLYGDIASENVFAKAGMHGVPSLVLSTIPDAMLKDVTNLRLLQMSKQNFPTTTFVGTSEADGTAIELYSNGADYVLMTIQLGAQRLADIIAVQTPKGGGTATSKSLDDTASSV